MSNIPPSVNMAKGNRITFPNTELMDSTCNTRVISLVAQSIMTSPVAHPKDAKKALDEMQKDLFVKSKKSLDEKIKPAKDYNEIKKIIDSAMLAKISWCENSKCEEKIKEDTGATMRAIPFGENVKTGAKCAVCGKAAKKVVYVGRSY